ADELRCNVTATLELSDRIHGDDVRMIERGGCQRLVFEQSRAALVSRELRRQHFQRDLTIERQLARDVDLAHPAGAEEREHAVTGYVASDEGNPAVIPRPVGDRTSHDARRDV